MSLIPGYPVGSNISALNIIHHRPEQQSNGKWSKHRLAFLYKDLDTGEVHKLEIDKPTYEYFMVKDGCSVDGPRDLYSRVEDCEPVEVEFSKITRDIAVRTSNLDVFNENIRNGNGRANKMLHLHPKVRNSDMKLPHNFLYRFDKQYKNDIFKPTKAYFDIETDNNYLPDHMAFPSDGACPVNAITYLNEETEMVNVYVLVDRTNESSMKFLEEMQDSGKAVVDELKDLCLNHVGKELYNRSVSNLKYNIRIFEDEITLITTFFQTVNKDKPNLLMAWNIAFDLPFLIDRLTVLGVDPRLVICSPEFDHKVCSYSIDTDTLVPTLKNDRYTISSYTTYIDQMVQFACRRKSDTSIGSYKLDNIGKMVCNVEKLSWNHIAKTFKDFIVRDFKMFIFYNVVDVLVQKCIEDTCGDMDFLVAMSILNCTPFQEVYKQTVSLKNRATKEFYDSGFIIGNNHNLSNSKDSFPGAFVADGRLLNDYSKLKVSGNPISLYNNLDDYDYRSLYPNTIRQFNISASTQVGHIVMDGMEIENENPYNNPYYNRAGRFMEDYSTANHLIFGHRWLGLGSYEEVYEDILEYGKYYGLDDRTTKLNMFETDFEPLPLMVKDNGYKLNMFAPIGRPNQEIVNKVNDIKFYEILDTQRGEC